MLSANCTKISSQKGTVLKNKYTRIVWGLYLVLWVFVSLAAFSGMYKLWWQRERIEYLGENVAEQRKVVFQHAGIPQSYLPVVDIVAEQWPARTHYSIQGNQVQGSYLSYLLIPHVPTGGEDYSIVLTEKATVTGELSLSDDLRVENKAVFFPAQGFVCSLLSIVGLVLLLRPLGRTYGLSVPELFAAACLFVNGAVVLSKVLFWESIPGFYLLLFFSVGGWFSLMCQRGSWALQRPEEDEYRFWQTIQGITRRKFVVWFCCFLIAFGVLWAMLMSVIVVPDDWDAWAIWGAKAKMLALGNGPLVDVSPFGHADYPLLWPSVWALSGWFGGGWDELWSRGWGAVFLFLCCWEIVVIVQRGTQRADIALLAGAIFVSVPLVPLIASWSYAEAPFWLVTVSCFGCLLLWRHSGRDFHLLWAALLAAAAAYTKNEGLLFSLIAAGWLLTVPGRRLYSLCLFLTVIVLLYAPWFYWVRIVSDFGSHATTGLSLSPTAIARALERLPKALEMIFCLYTDIRLWNLVLWGLGVAWVMAFWKPKALADVLIPSAILSGYLLIVVFHQAEIYWQVGTSWNRLTIQMFPLLIVIVIPRIWKGVFVE